MDIEGLEKRLEDVKREALAGLRRAASGDDTSAIIAAGDRLKSLNALEEKLEGARTVVMTVDAALQRYLRIGTDGRAHRPSSNDAAPLSAKARGELRRKHFVERLSAAEGIELQNLSGVLYETPSGAVVGIPTASPLDDSPNRWWLGLPGDQFDLAALLCEHDDGRIVALVLDEDFLSKHGRSLSRDERGQEKFVVLFEGGSYYLQVPNVGRINVDSYRDKFDRFV